MPARLDATLTCTSGTTVTIDGALVLEGLAAQFVFSNNVMRTHERTEDLGARLVLIAEGDDLAIPTQTVDGEPAAEPTVSIQILDADGNPIGDEIVLGSCGLEPLSVNETVEVDAMVTLTVSAAGCHNNPGPTITVDGAVTFEGLQQRVIVRDGDATVGEVTTRADVVALADGETLSFPKQPSRGGVGGNPWIWARLFDDDGDALTEEILLGRCVELAGEGGEDDGDTD